MAKEVEVDDDSIYDQAMKEFGQIKLDDCVEGIKTKTTVVVGANDPFCILSDKDAQDQLLRSIHNKNAIQVVEFGAPFGHLSYISSSCEKGVE